MTIYRQFSGLLNEIECFAEHQEFPEAEKLIRKARQAMRKDLRDKINHLSSSRNAKSEIVNHRRH